MVKEFLSKLYYKFLIQSNYNSKQSSCLGSLYLKSRVFLITVYSFLGYKIITDKPTKKLSGERISINFVST